jgi:hypothetical protein
MMLCGICYGYAKTALLHVVLSKMWQYGNLLWSDVIYIPAHGRSTCSNSNEDIHRCSYHDNDHSIYYFICYRRRPPLPHNTCGKGNYYS